MALKGTGVLSQATLLREQELARPPLQQQTLKLPKKSPSQRDDQEKASDSFGTDSDMHSFKGGILGNHCIL